MLKCDFNKVAKCMQLYGNHTWQECSPVNLHIFRTTFLKNTSASVNAVIAFTFHIFHIIVKDIEQSTMF